MDLGVGGGGSLRPEAPAPGPGMQSRPGRVGGSWVTLSGAWKALALESVRLLCSRPWQPSISN